MLHFLKLPCVVGMIFSSHFTDEKNEAQRGPTSWLRSHSKKDPSPRSQTPVPTAAPPGSVPGCLVGILLYYFPGALLIVQTERLAHSLYTARCLIVQTVELVTQSLPF